MKPIFKEEKKFLENKLGIELPNNCWRSTTKIYLNHFDEKPFLTFKVIPLENKLIIKKYTEPTHKNYSLEEEYYFIKDILDSKVRESIIKTKEFTLKHKEYKVFVSISGGKDSDVMKHIVDMAFKELKSEGHNVSYNLVAFNTSNDSAETYKHLKQYHGMNKNNIISPSLGFYPWIKQKKNYFTPSKFVRNCCSTYKEGQLTSIMDKKENTLTFLGMRASESNKRSHYDWDLNKAQLAADKKLNVPENWKRFLPIVKWTDAEVWLFILNNKLQYNKMYDLGFNRVGCLICCFQHDYIDLLIRHYYPKQWSRWEDILSKGYEIYRVEKTLKWDINEWILGGKWKNATSKESEIITKKATPERLKTLAELKGISTDMAAKYFNKVCSCGKKLNPTEIAMFLKLNGRYEGVEDKRSYLCKKCLCEYLNISSNEYKEKQIAFSEEGCNLF